MEIIVGLVTALSMGGVLISDDFARAVCIVGISLSLIVNAAIVESGLIKIGWWKPRRTSPNPLSFILLLAGCAFIPYALIVGPEVVMGW